MPGHGNKNSGKPEVQAQISEFPCWHWHRIHERIYELQAGRRVDIGSFNHCLRRYMSPLPPFEIPAIRRIDHPTAGCADCRYETTAWLKNVKFFNWRSKLTHATVINLMARELDAGTSRGSMEICARGVTYTPQEAADNYDKPKPVDGPDEYQEPFGRPMPAPMTQEDLK